MTFFCWCVSTQAQRITDPVLKNIVKTTLSTYDKKPFEKLYIQTDKTAYLRGDTLRLKAYLLNGDYLSPSAQSGILYVELDNDAGSRIKRLMLPLSYGLAWADMPLDTGYVAPGNYTLRAYTNWMRNFGEDYIFKKKITVSGHQGNSILASSSFKQSGKQVETALQFRTLDGKLMSFKDVELKLMSGKKNVSKNKLTTDPDGKIKLNFAMPDGNEQLNIKAMIAGSPEFTVPVTLPRLENIDVQFMPEGGALVAGIMSKVGVKAIGEDGEGVNISGKLFNSKSEEVAVINTTYKGMGNFTFTPQANEIYTAKLNGSNKTYPLPQVNQAGTVLSVTSTHIDSIKINIADNSNKSYYLIGQARGVVCYAEPVNLSNGKTTKAIAKRLFPTGIARFTLLNSAQQPVNERIVFINHKDELKISIQPGKTHYTTRDSIALTVNVTDKDGKPVQGSFSMAVTDNSQVSIDSLGSNMLTHLLLTSDLKGDIEQPGYYFTGNKDAELDNLMLTQGWVGYAWNELLATTPQPIAYQPQREYIISGKVTNAFGGAIEKSPIVLLSNKPFVLMDTLSGKDGRFEFKNIFPLDTAMFKLQARNKNKKEFNVSIVMDKQTFPGFKADPKPAQPWYVNTDTTLLRNAKTVIAEEKAKREYRGEGTQLGQVEIKAKKAVKGSKNLNGPGEADLVLDEQDMLMAEKKTLEDLLNEKVKGFFIGSFTPFKRKYDKFLGMQEIDEFILAKDFPHLMPEYKGQLGSFFINRKQYPWRFSYMLYSQEVHFIIDGIDLDRFFDDKDEVVVERGRKIFVIPNDYKRYQYIQTYLKYFTAEDILGIEVMSSGPYTNKYNADFDVVNDRVGPSKVNEIAYIEITTRSKEGPFMKATPGTYFYKPLAFTLPKQFYRPKYTAANKNTAIGTDMRSTIFWEPNMITDVAGKATVSFYSADKAADYTMIIEGTDMSGGLGFGKNGIKIK